MALTARNLFVTDARRDTREDVHFRTRATAANRLVADLLIVNISARGLMARCDDDRIEPDTAIDIRLPGIGVVRGQVRWALGGRLGVEFDTMIELAPYLQMLAEAVRK